MEILNRIKVDEGRSGNNLLEALSKMEPPKSDSDTYKMPEARSAAFSAHLAGVADALHGHDYDSSDFLGKGDLDIQRIAVRTYKNSYYGTLKDLGKD